MVLTGHLLCRLQPNLLTAAADDRWKAIRKAVAVSFSAQNIKKKFPMILERVNEVVRRSAKLGPKASIDVDQTALRVTLDVIGLVRVMAVAYVAWVAYAARVTSRVCSSAQKAWRYKHTRELPCGDAS